MLTIPNLEKYRQGDFIQYMNNVLEIFNPTRVSNFNVVPQFEALQQAVQQLNSAWQPNMGSELTPEIVDLDQRRDSAFVGFKMMMENWATNHFAAAIRQAAAAVSDMIAAHGSQIHRMRYQQQTATLNSIIRELEGPYANHVMILDVPNWLLEIKTLNREFNDKYLQRVAAMAGHQTGVMEGLINKVIIAFRQLKTLVEARFRVAEADGSLNADFQPAINELNELTQQYNDAVNRYTGNGEKEPEKETEPEQPSAAPDPAPQS